MLDLPGVSEGDLPKLLAQAHQRLVRKSAFDLFVRMCPRGPYRLRVRKIIRNHLLDHDDLDQGLDSLEKHIKTQSSIPPEYANFGEELAEFLTRYVPYVLGSGEKSAVIKDLDAWFESAAD